MIRRHLLKWSFRRLRKDGRLPIITKYTLATVYVLLFGRIDHTFFNYPMGGLYFSNASDRSKQEVDKYISKIRLTFNKLFNQTKVLKKPVKNYLSAKKLKTFLNKYLSKLS